MNTTATAPKPTTAAQVEAFVAACRAVGFTWTTAAGTGVVTVSTKFTPGNDQAYVVADNLAYCLLDLVPIVGAGSTWGTDSASVGGHAGLTGGYYRLSRSGASKRFVKALAKVAR